MVPPYAVYTGMTRCHHHGIWIGAPSGATDPNPGQTRATGSKPTFIPKSNRRPFPPGGVMTSSRWLQSFRFLALLSLILSLCGCPTNGENDAATSPWARPTPPTITAHPASVTVAVGATATFTVQANGTTPLTYRWQKRNGPNAAWANLQGASSPTLTLTAVSASSNGSQYRSIVRNRAGSATSNPATLTVTSAPSTAYYVAPTGSDSGLGTLTSPWRTITYAVSAASRAPAGATIYVKAGLYSNENVVFEKDGITLIGYKTTPGDQPPILANSPNPFAPFNPADMPLLDGGNRNQGIGINLRGRKDITLQNISVMRYAYGVIAGNSSQSFVEHHLLTNVNVSTTGNVSDDYSGIGISLGSMGTQYSNGVTVRNALIVNAAAEGLTLNGDGNLADNVKVYCNENTGYAATDYYVMVTGNDNIVQNSLANRKPGLAHSGHGFSIKSNAEQVVDRGQPFPIVDPERNLFRNNVAYNLGEGFVVRHRGVRFNTFRDNKAYGTHTGWDDCGDGNGISIRDGASDNQFINTLIENVCSAISFNDTTEDGDSGPHPPGHPGNNNVIDNAIVNNAYVGLDFNEYDVQSDAGANTIRNSRFTLTRYMFYAHRHATLMRYLNSSFSGTALVTPPTDGEFSVGPYAQDVQPTQFTACTFTNIEGGLPAGF